MYQRYLAPELLRSIVCSPCIIEKGVAPVKQMIYAMLAVGLASGVPRAQDPTETDGDKYHVIFENAEVRVLDYQDKPGAKTFQHHHPKSALYALTAFKREPIFPDGKSTIREFKPGDVLWLEEQTHVGENIGQTDTHVILVEIKEPSKDATPETGGRPETTKSSQ